MRRRVVLDANAIVSGILGLKRERSKPGEVLRRFFNGDFDLVISDHILNESGDVVARRWFVARGVTEPAKAILEIMRTDGIVVPLPEEIQRICRDSKDDAVIATAVAGNAAYLVTGDDDLLILDSVGGVRILEPAAFVAILEAADIHGVNGKD